jgi:prepilin-type N-terminal cleavage/methylation domain-containing protein
MTAEGSVAMKSGFTLIELLVVIVILSILAGLMTVGIVAFLKASKVHATEAQIGTMAGAAEIYHTDFGAYPPSSMAELGARSANDVNNGIEAMVPCLSILRSGRIYYENEAAYSNMDGDSADRNLTGWYFGDSQLREVCDAFGSPLYYVHCRNYGSPPASLRKVRLAPGSAEVEVFPEINPATKAFVRPSTFQLRSAGPDGAFGTDDDIRSGH